MRCRVCKEGLGHHFFLAHVWPSANRFPVHLTFSICEMGQLPISAACLAPVTLALCCLYRLYPHISCECREMLFSSLC